MQLPLQITFHNMERSAAVAEMVREKVQKLDKYADHLVSCRVVVEMPHRHHRNGNQYQVRIDMTVPGNEIVVNREPPQHTEYEDLAVALRDAFQSARRRLEDFVRERRGFVKTQGRPPHGQVSQLFPKQGYGFITTPSGEEVYFHRHSVLNGGFDSLEVGVEVTFAREIGEKGPQASTVKRTGRHGGACPPCFHQHSKLFSR